MAFPEPSSTQVEALLEKHGLGHRAVARLPSTGVINTVIALGDDLVLRVPKATPDGLSDTYTESVAAPVAHAAGVKTPALVVFDDDLDILEVPYTIYERVAGGPLSTVALEEPDYSGVYREIGRDLAVLHQRVSVVDDPLGRLDNPGRWETPEFTQRLVRHGFITTDNAATIERLHAQLEPAIILGRSSRRFLHDDAAPSNVMVSANGRYEAIIDWGDAGWGDSALDFCYLPMRAIPHALLGYREVMPLDMDETAEARILWDHIWSAVTRLDYRPDPSPRAATSARPGARLIDLIDFLAAKDGQAWLSRTIGKWTTE